MKKINMLSRILSGAIVACMMITNQPWTFAAAEEQQTQEMAKQYVSDVKMFYGEDEAQARTLCEEDGYIFSDVDLKQGSKSDSRCYLGYKITEDPEEAITKLSLLDMRNSHYEELTYEEYLDKYIGDYASQAAGLMVMVNAYRNGLDQADPSPSAVAALDSLNFFYMDELMADDMETWSNEEINSYFLTNQNKNKQQGARVADDSKKLGNYMRNEMDQAMMMKLLQRTNAEVMATIVDCLAAATADYHKDSGTWVDRAKCSTVYYEYVTGASSEVNGFDSMYQDTAKRLLQECQSFAADYREMQEKYEQYGDTFGYDVPSEYTQEDLDAIPDCRIPDYLAALELYSLANNYVYQEAGEELITYDMLVAEQEAERLREESPDADIPSVEHQTYQETKTLAQLFLEIGEDENMSNTLEKLYPLVWGMTSAQREVLHQCGLMKLTKTLFPDNDYLTNRSQTLNERRKEFREKTKEIDDCDFYEDCVSVWYGIDRAIYNKRVAETSSLIQRRKAGDVYDDITKAAQRKGYDKKAEVLSIIRIVNYSVTAAVAIGSMVSAVVLHQLAAFSFRLAICIVIKTMAFGIAKILAVAALSLGYFLFWASILISLALLIYDILSWCGVFDDGPERIQYDTIPDVLFDVQYTSKGNYRVRYDVVRSNISDLILRSMMYNGDLNIFESTYGNKKKKKMDKFPTKEERDKILEEEGITYIGGVALCTVLFAARFGITLEGLINDQYDYADMGAYQSEYDRWQVLYYSKDEKCGSPIEVIPGEPLLKAQQDDSNPKPGWQPLTLVDEVYAADVNIMKIDKKIGTPLFLFYPGDSDLIRSGDVTNANRFVNKVEISHNDDQGLAVDYLKKGGYEEIFMNNLTPGDGYTYLGIKYGSKEEAITDFRVATMGLDNIQFGDALYSKCSDQKGQASMSADGFMLYYTKNAAAGSPIVSLSVESERVQLGSDGREPVCLFSGGQAVDWSHKWRDNAMADVLAGYDKNAFAGSYSWGGDRLTTQDDVKKGVYLYFTPQEQFKAQSEDDKPPYVSGFSYFLAADNKHPDKKYYQTNQAYMRAFAKENGFTLIDESGNLMEDNETGKPAQLISAEEGKLNPIHDRHDKEGAFWKDLTWDCFHTVYYNYVIQQDDSGYGYNVGGSKLVGGDGRLMRKMWDIYDDWDCESELYFGVSYTYNPYRAITDVSALVTPYTETTSQLKYTGLNTPGGAMRACNVSIMGYPIENAGVCMAYYDAMGMALPFYTNCHARQKQTLSWMTKDETDVMSHYLLTAGPVKGKLPIERDDLMFVTHANPGQYDGYVPLIDLRIPDDYDHPMNLAYETTNKGSKYFYMYLRNDAGGRDGEGNTAHNVYKKKKYIAGVFVGTGRTPEAAIADLYSRASQQWDTIVKECPDVPASPMMREAIEIQPIDLSEIASLAQDKGIYKKIEKRRDEAAKKGLTDDVQLLLGEYAEEQTKDLKAWYSRKSIDVGKTDPGDNKWTKGSQSLDLLWNGHKRIGFKDKLKSVDDFEKNIDHAYIGFVRTDTCTDTGPVRTLMKYFSATAPKTLTVGDTQVSLAGGPIVSTEGSYYLYYSRNKGTATFAAPATDIVINKEMFTNGSNTAYSCYEKDRVNNVLPDYADLRMRLDEEYYFHTTYDVSDMPYIEAFYVGTGKTQKGAWAEMVYSTGACGVSGVNCNYNSYTDQWIAIGYRRTDDAASAIRDVFLYQGDDPPDELYIPGAFKKSGSKFNPYKQKVLDKETKTFVEVEGLHYSLMKRNLITQAVPFSLNEGTGGPNIYLYYADKNSGTICYEADATKQLKPIRNFCFGYGDISPEQASAESLANIYVSTVHGLSSFNVESYSHTHWENVLAIHADDPLDYKLDGSNGTPLSLNYGTLPKVGNNMQHTAGDKQIRMYVDRGSTKDDGCTHRTEAELNNEGYYSSKDTYVTMHIK
ncbi:MAG: hypothetical protein K5695_13025 [Oscillospiraceae bacterium]|nr:hypothetical protein [Oscillospiraceae bacterium]